VEKIVARKALLTFLKMLYNNFNKYAPDIRPDNQAFLLISGIRPDTGYPVRPGIPILKAKTVSSASLVTSFILFTFRKTSVKLYLYRYLDLHSSQRRDPDSHMLNVYPVLLLPFLAAFTVKYFVQGVRELLKKCVIVPGEDRLSLQANDNATILFQCLVR
jgi:hypothetical protein